MGLRNPLGEGDTFQVSRFRINEETVRLSIEGHPTELVWTVLPGAQYLVVHAPRIPQDMVVGRISAGCFGFPDFSVELKVTLRT